MIQLSHLSRGAFDLFFLSPTSTNLTPIPPPNPCLVPLLLKGNGKWPTNCLCDLTKASVISPEKALAVPRTLAGAEGCFMLLSPQLTASRTGGRAGWSWLAGWLAVETKQGEADLREIEIL